jgi:hypothetical protein
MEAFPREMWNSAKLFRRDDNQRQPNIILIPPADDTTTRARHPNLIERLGTSRAVESPPRSWDLASLGTSFLHTLLYLWLSSSAQRLGAYRCLAFGPGPNEEAAPKNQCLIIGIRHTATWVAETTGPWHNCMHRQGDDLDLIEYLMCIYYEVDGDNPCTKGGIRGPCARARSL